MWAYSDWKPDAGIRMEIIMSGVGPHRLEDVDVPTPQIICIWQHRDHCFWIDDRDIPSKRLFSFIMFIFTLVETGGREGAPIVKIPAG